jgi:hypothetical protein
MKIDAALNRAIAECGFLNADVVEAFASHHNYSNQPLLIVSHGGRMTVPAYRVPGTVKLLEEKGDYVRSVQIPKGHSLERLIWKGPPHAFDNKED